MGILISFRNQQDESELNHLLLNAYFQINHIQFIRKLEVKSKTK